MNDANDELPVFTQQQYNRLGLRETAGIGTSVIVVRATDPDTGESCCEMADESKEVSSSFDPKRTDLSAMTVHSIEHSLLTVFKALFLLHGLPQFTSSFTFSYTLTQEVLSKMHTKSICTALKPK